MIAPRSLEATAHLFHQQSRRIRSSIPAKESVFRRNTKAPPVSYIDWWCQKTNYISIM